MNLTIFVPGSPSSTTLAPMTLCLVTGFDLANETNRCPPDRSALKELFDSMKGGEWTNGSKWNEERSDYCSWHGVTCDESNNVMKLELRNNGLSGRLSTHIGDLRSLVVVDLSDNDIKVSTMLSMNQFTRTNLQEFMFHTHPFTFCSSS